MMSRHRVAKGRAVPRRLRFVVPVLCLAVVGGLLGGSCGISGNPEPAPTGVLEIAQVKVPAWRDRIGQTVEVRGLLRLNEDGTGVLFPDLEAYHVLGFLPESDYLPLTFENVEAQDPSIHELSEMRIAGVVQETTDPSRTFRSDEFGDLTLCEIGTARVTEILRTRWTPIPEYVQPCESAPGLCDRPVATVAEKYAILFCGGDRKDKFYECFWNEIVLYYALLVWRYGFDRAPQDAQAGPAAAP